MDLFQGCLGLFLLYSQWLVPKESRVNALIYAHFGPSLTGEQVDYIYEQAKAFCSRIYADRCSGYRSAPPCFIEEVIGNPLFKLYLLEQIPDPDWDPPGKRAPATRAPAPFL